MRRSLIILALVAIACSCITSPKPRTLDEAMERYDWSEHTEEQFWQTYPQFRKQYDINLGIT